MSTKVLKKTLNNCLITTCDNVILCLFDPARLVTGKYYLPASLTLITAVTGGCEYTFEYEGDLLVDPSMNLTACEVRTVERVSCLASYIADLITPLIPVLPAEHTSVKAVNSSEIDETYDPGAPVGEMVIPGTTIIDQATITNPSPEREMNWTAKVGVELTLRYTPVNPANNFDISLRMQVSFDSGATWQEGPQVGLFAPNAYNAELARHDKVGQGWISTALPVTIPPLGSLTISTRGVYNDLSNLPGVAEYKFPCVELFGVTI